MRSPLVRFRWPRISRLGSVEPAGPRLLPFTLGRECEDGVEAIQKCEEAVRRVNLTCEGEEEGRGRCPRPGGKDRKAAPSLGTRWEREDRAGDGGTVRQKGEGRLGALSPGSRRKGPSPASFPRHVSRDCGNSSPRM